MELDLEIDRTRTNSKRWQGRGETIALTIGDSDFRLPGSIYNALSSRLDEGVVGYDAVPESLKDLIIGRLHELYAWQVQPEWLVFLPGVVPGLNIAGRGLTHPDQAIATETPIYYPFFDVPANADRRMLELPAVLGDQRWCFDLERFEDLARMQNIGMLMLCNPQNPLGRVLHREELLAIAELCLSHEIVLCSDEIHCDLIYTGYEHIPIASLGLEISNSTVTLMSPSKAFGISGIGGAFAVIPNPAIRAQFEAAAAGINPGLMALPIAAMQAAYGECLTWLDETVSYLQANRDFLYENLREIRGIDLVNPEGTYFLWIDFSKTGFNDPYTVLCEAGVELSNGDTFGDYSYLRLNFASPRARLEKALSRLQTLFG